MFSKGELSVVPDIQENREGIADHSFSINGDVGLPGYFCTVQTEEGRLAPEAQSRLSRPSDLLSTFGCKDTMIMPFFAGTASYRQITSVDTLKGIVPEFDLEIVYVDCEKEG